MVLESWEKLEIEYAEKLKRSSYEERKKLYSKAYSEVSKLRMATMSPDPEKRTAGTTKGLVKSLIKLCKSGDRVLEIGCGRGYTCWKLAPHVNEIIGTDISVPALNESRELLKKKHVSNVKILNVSGYELTDKFEKETFDKIISIDVYEHLHPEDAGIHLSQVYSLLKSDGKYIILTPNRHTGPHDVTKLISPKAKEAIGFHLNETTNMELLESMKKVGFSKFHVFKWIPVVDIGPIVYPIFFDLLAERLYKKIVCPILGRFLTISLIAYKNWVPFKNG